MQAAPATDRFQTITCAEFIDRGAPYQTKLAAAAKLGFFYLEMTARQQELVQSAWKFAERFHEDEEFKALDFGGLSRHNDREHVQNQAVYMERAHWGKVKQYEGDIHALAFQMDKLGIEILESALSLFNVPRALWSLATGRLTDGEGLRHLTFNHYRPKRRQPGLKPHRDFGYVTVLCINQDGLQVRLESEWVPLPPKDGHFVINFGRTLETFINRPDFKAAWHRVIRVNRNRSSIGWFSDGDPDTPIHRWIEGANTEEVYPTVQSFLKEAFSEAHEEGDIDSR